VAYADRAYLEIYASTDALVEVTSTSDNPGQINWAACDAALSAGSATVDSYYARIGVAVPLTSPGDDVKVATCAIAMHALRAPRDKTTLDSRTAYEAAIKWLQGLVDTYLAKLKIDASVADSGTVVDPDTYEPVFVPATRVWTRKNAGGVM